MLVAVIMAGGAGTRFWPLSTQDKPKQFLSLIGGRSLLQHSYDRVKGLISPDKILVLTNDSYRGLVANQLPELPNANIIGEPIRKDTAAAVALAALLCRHRFGNATMITLTADHLIEPVDRFIRVLSEAADACQDGLLYTIGIAPTYPATQFGYLYAKRLVKRGEFLHFEVAQFKEKPDRDTARKFIDSGMYYWNSGMFVWGVETILAEFQRRLPRHLEILEPVVGALEEDGSLNKSSLLYAFQKLERISIDYAILEKSRSVRTIVADIIWDDLGGWRAVAQYLSLDNSGNRLHGSVWSEEANDNVVFSEDPGEEILLLGVEDLVVVRAGQRTLVAHRDHLDSLKAAVENLVNH